LDLVLGGRGAFLKKKLKPSLRNTLTGGGQSPEQEGDLPEITKRHYGASNTPIGAHGSEVHFQGSGDGSAKQATSSMKADDPMETRAGKRLWSAVAQETQGTAVSIKQKKWEWLVGAPGLTAGLWHVYDPCSRPRSL
jgi:hypothetical protein